MGKKRRSRRSTGNWFQDYGKYIGLVLVASVSLGLVAFAVGRPQIAPAVSAGKSVETPLPEVIPTPDPLLAGVPTGAEALIIGDSYTQGHAATEDNGYAYVLGRSLGWQTTVNGVGGSGYAAGGGAGGVGSEQFTNRITSLASSGISPAVVILQGGQNDFRVTKPELTTIVTDTVNQVKDAWPSAIVVVVGPSAPYPLAKTTSGLSETIKAGAQNANTPFVDVLTLGWFTEENSPTYAHTDGSHLNTAGHQYMADQLAAWLTTH